MEIETAGSSKKNGAKFAVVVTDKGITKEFTYDLEAGHTLNQAELIALKFAILGIIDPQEEATIITPNRYVASMIEKDMNGWAKTPKSNVELINELRNLIDDRSVKIIIGKSEKAKALCK